MSVPLLQGLKKPGFQGRPHIGIYTLQIGSFSPNTATKFHGRRQPCRGILSCLVKKSLVLECFAVLNRRFFFTAATGDRVNTACIPRETGAVVEEKIHSKPCKSPCESAQDHTFFAFVSGSCDNITAVNTSTQPRISQFVSVSLRIRQPHSTANTDSRLMISDAAEGCKCC